MRVDHVYFHHVIRVNDVDIFLTLRKVNYIIPDFFIGVKRKTKKIPKKTLRKVLGIEDPKRHQGGRIEYYRAWRDSSSRHGGGGVIAQR